MMLYSTKYSVLRRHVMLEVTQTRKAQLFIPSVYQLCHWIHSSSTSKKASSIHSFYHNEHKFDQDANSLVSRAISSQIKNICFNPPKYRSLSTSEQKDDDSSKKGLDNKALGAIWVQMQTVPNVLTMSRIIFTPLLGYWIVSEQYMEAFVGCGLTAATDVLDGMIARRYPETQATVLGAYLDPMADKVLINTLALSLCYQDVLPLPMVALWLMKDIGLVITCYYAVAKHTPSGTAVMDPLRTPLQVTPSNMSKFNTLLQFTTLSLSLLLQLPSTATAPLLLSSIPTSTLPTLWYVFETSHCQLQQITCSTTVSID